MSLIYIIALATTFISSSFSQSCSFSGLQESQNSCTNTDFGVYTSLTSDTNNDWKAWAKAGVNTIISWSGMLFSGLYANPVGVVVNKVGVNLSNAIFSETSESPNWAEIISSFAAAVEAEFTKLQECIDQKITDAFAEDAINKVSAFLTTFEDLNTFDYTLLLANEKFNNLWGDLRFFIDEEFNPFITASQTADECAAHLPVHELFMTVYDELASAYFIWILACENYNNEYSQNILCPSISLVMTEIHDDINTLQQFLEIAHDTIYDSYQLRPEYYDEEHCNLGYWNAQRDEANYVFVHDHRLKQFDFCPDSTAVMREINMDDDWVDVYWDMTDDYTCDMGKFLCDTWTDGQYMNADVIEKPTSACQTLLIGAVESKIPEIISDTIAWSDNFKTHYYEPMDTFADKMDMLEWAGDNLKRGNELISARFLDGECLYSPSGEYKLCMQSNDGNLVFRDGNGAALWNSQTNGNSGAKLALQNDGNLVIYSSGAIWSTKTHSYGTSNGPYNLGVSDGGFAYWITKENVIIWSTNSDIIEAEFFEF